MKSAGKVRKVGASVYTAAQIDGLLSRYPLDLIQAPVSVLDQRLVRSGHLRKLKDSGVEVHVRSVFLQGLLLMPPEAVPEKLERARPRLAELRRHLAPLGVTPLQAALGFVLAMPEINRVIVGVDSLRQLQDILSAAEGLPSIPDLGRFALEDARLLNPALWGT